MQECPTAKNHECLVIFNIVLLKETQTSTTKRHNYFISTDDFPCVAILFQLWTTGRDQQLFLEKYILRIYNQGFKKQTFPADHYITLNQQNNQSKAIFFIFSQRGSYLEEFVD